MSTQEFKIQGSVYDKLMELADYDYQCSNNKPTIQCNNSLHGRRVGIFAEYSAALFLKNKLSSNKIKHNIDMLGLKERKQNKSFNKGDILIKLQNNDMTIEVKGVSKGYPIGQILPYHVNKYIKARTDRVCLVELEINLKESFVAGKVYNCVKPKEILSWDLKNNLRGQPCYTNSEVKEL